MTRDNDRPIAGIAYRYVAIPYVVVMVVASLFLTAAGKWCF